jgi:thiomorpholine-carboxylate dehydrogenase
MTLFLDAQRVRELLPMADLIPAMEQALIDFSAGRAQQPLRTVMAVEPPGGYCYVMPAVAQAIGVKIVSLYPGNAAKGLPSHMAMIFLMDRDSGAPLAVMDGEVITAMRTAAVSAAATQRLAAADAKVLAILGSGVQARSHYQALRLVRDFAEIRVWSPTPAHCQAFAEEIGAACAADAEQAVRGADVVVTATSATQPVLRGAWLKPGCHVNAVGAPRPDWRELDDGVMAQRLFVDSRASALAESGDVILSGAAIYAEIGEVLAGRVPAHSEDTTVFKSLGLAVEDVAAAWLVYQRATV